MHGKRLTGDTEPPAANGPSGPVARTAATLPVGIPITPPSPDRKEKDAPSAPGYADNSQLLTATERALYAKGRHNPQVGITVEPRDGAQATGDGGAGAPPRFQVAREALDVRAPRAEQGQAAGVAPVGVLAQVQLVGLAGQAGGWGRPGPADDENLTVRRPVWSRHARAQAMWLPPPDAPERRLRSACRGVASLALAASTGDSVRRGFGAQEHLARNGTSRAGSGRERRAEVRRQSGMRRARSSTSR